tara:strand:- start:343 stop:750 length:408 start_codon:yes stop_codon:yes gene_type:complete
MKLLILHGPNMNLFGIRSSKAGKNITLDKINKHIRKYIRDKKIEVKILQTHNEVKAVSYLHSNRNNFDGLILTPGIWQKSGYILKDTIDIIEIPYFIINTYRSNQNDLFEDKMNLNHKDDIFKNFEQALDYYVSK